MVWQLDAPIPHTLFFSKGVLVLGAPTAMQHMTRGMQRYASHSVLLMDTTKIFSGCQDELGGCVGHCAGKLWRCGPFYSTGTDNLSALLITLGIHAHLGGLTGLALHHTIWVRRGGVQQWARGCLSLPAPGQHVEPICFHSQRTASQSMISQEPFFRR